MQDFGVGEGWWIGGREGRGWGEREGEGEGEGERERGRERERDRERVCASIDRSVRHSASPVRRWDSGINSKYGRGESAKSRVLRSFLFILLNPSSVHQSINNG